MSDRYLWDGTGPVDPEIERLERALAPLRPGKPLVMKEARVRRRWPWVVGVATVACAAALLLVVRPRPAAVQVKAPAPVVQAGDETRGVADLGWEVTVTAGAPAAPAQPTIDGRPITDSGRLGPGQVLETGARAKVRLAVPSIGAVDVDPRTRLGLVETGQGAHRIRLEVGTIHAVIWSPPGTFFVETPAGTAVDLGCAYAVTVGDDGNGLLRVHTGWVGFERGGRESFVPAGAECALRRDRVPGTPVPSDAPAEVRAALAALDDPAGEDGPEDRARALRRLLNAARPQEVVTLWHLLHQASTRERALLLRRLVALAPAARKVNRAGVLAGDPHALDQLWDRLDLGPIAQWRQWKARQPLRP